MNCAKPNLQECVRTDTHKKGDLSPQFLGLLNEKILWKNFFVWAGKYKNTYEASQGVDTYLAWLI